MRRYMIALLLAVFMMAFAQDNDTEIVLPNLEGRVITVGTDATYPPFENVDEDGNIVGFDIEVTSAICELINCVLDFQATAWDGIFPALAAGEFDMVASGVTITPERDEIVDFSEPYFTVSQAIALRPDDTGVTLAELIEGDYSFGAQIGTTNAKLAEDFVGRDRVQLYNDFNAAMLALINGDVDAVVIDDTPADAFEQEYAGEITVGLRNVTGEEPEYLGFAFQEGSELIDAFDAGLAVLQANGRLEALRAAYFD